MEAEDCTNSRVGWLAWGASGQHHAAEALRRAGPLLLGAGLAGRLGGYYGDRGQCSGACCRETGGMWSVTAV